MLLLTDTYYDNSAHVWLLLASDTSHQCSNVVQRSCIDYNLEGGGKSHDSHTTDRITENTFSYMQAFIFCHCTYAYMQCVKVICACVWGGVSGHQTYSVVWPRISWRSFVVTKLCVIGPNSPLVQKTLKCNDTCLRQPPVHPCEEMTADVVSQWNLWYTLTDTSLMRTLSAVPTTQSYVCTSLPLN